MNNLILHIPHSSKHIPCSYVHEYTDKEELEETILKLTDIYTDELFDADSSCCTKIVFPFSRVFCDVERFNDEREEMLKYGQGVIYTHGINGRKFRAPSDHSVSDIIQNYYEKHKSKVREKIRELEDVILIDCHSFPDDMNKYAPPNLINYGKLPDICIGYNQGDYVSQNLSRFIADYLNELGYKTAFNYPFSGSYQIDNVTSVMIEINKRLYLNEDHLSKRSDFYKTKALLNGLMKQIEKYETTNCLHRKR